MQDEFVNFAILLQRQQGDTVYTLTVDNQSGQPNFVLAPKSKKTKLLFTRWVEAWNIFVYMLQATQKHPTHPSLGIALMLQATQKTPNSPQPWHSASRWYATFSITLAGLGVL